MIPVNIRWPLIIVSALTLHVVVSLAVAFVAVSDPSRAVEADYYQKALHWDEKKAQDATNLTLGWTLPFETETESPGSVLLRARLLDDRGEPLAGAHLGVTTFHNARAAEILRDTLRDQGDGWYAATLPMRRGGRWELRFEAEHDGKTFTLVENRYIDTGRAP